MELYKCMLKCVCKSGWRASYLHFFRIHWLVDGEHQLWSRKLVGILPLRCNGHPIFAVVPTVFLAAASSSTAGGQFCRPTGKTHGTVPALIVICLKELTHTCFIEKRSKHNALLFFKSGTDYLTGS